MKRNICLNLLNDFLGLRPTLQPNWFDSLLLTGVGYAHMKLAVVGGEIIFRRSRNLSVEETR